MGCIRKTTETSLTPAGSFEGAERGRGVEGGGVYTFIILQLPTILWSAA